MPIDTSIYGGLLGPQRSALDYQNEYAQADTRKNQNALQALALRQQTDATQQSLTERNALRQIAAGSNGDRNALILGMRNSGLPGLMTQADALEQSGAKLAESQSLASKNNADAGQTSFKTRLAKANQAITDISVLSSPQDAVGSIKQHLASGDIDEAKAQSLLATLQPALQDPSQFGAWQRKMILGIMDAKDRISATAPNVQMVNTGGAMVPTNVNPDAGQIGAVGAPMQRTVDPSTVYAQGQENARSAASIGATNERALQTIAAEDRRFATTQGAGKPLTEDQGKATGWLSQATNAFANMQAAMKEDSGAATPGVGDGIAKIPGLGGLGNALTGASRQKFNQASGSLSEALLRAATGAGINESEARQKIQEITPAFGDSDELKKQKLASIPIYIESLKVRAGPGAAKVAQPAQPAQPAVATASPFKITHVDGKAL